MSGELIEDIETEPMDASSEQQRRQQSSPWGLSFANIFARLADAADATGNRADRRDRERNVEASTSGREDQHDAATVLTRADSGGSLTSRSLGGILRQLSGRRESTDSRADGETTAAAAERHRLTGATSSIDLQALTHWTEKNAPFMFILFCVFVSKHVVGLLVAGFIAAILATGNSFIRKQIALKESRRVVRIFLMMGLLTLVVPLLLLLPQSCLSWRAIVLLLPPKVETIWDCLFCISIADGAIRIITMVAKVCSSRAAADSPEANAFAFSQYGKENRKMSPLQLGVVAFSRTSPEEGLRRRSQLLTLFEHISLLYRALVPTPLWFVYLYKSRGVLSSIFTGAFLATKCQFVYERANNVAASVRSVWRKEAHYGRFLAPEELVEAGNSCAICQVDWTLEVCSLPEHEWRNKESREKHPSDVAEEPMTRPFQLTQCRHVFCEACLTEWLERQSTCPMCRAVVRPLGMHAFGNGAVSLLPQLF